MSLFMILVLCPMIGGLICGIWKKCNEIKTRNAVVSLFLVLNLALVLFSFKLNDSTYTLIHFTSGLALMAKADMIAHIFSCLFAFMWLLVGIYSFEYMKHEEHKPRFYLFYLCTLGCLNGVAFSGNYLTLYTFFELMTLLSMPMVLHEQTKEAISAAKKYLMYSIFGATLGLAGYFFMEAYGSSTFVAGGALDMVKVSGHENLLRWVCLISIIGFGAKGGLFPLHDWLPTAHPVAPACASSILSGVITKAGVLAIIRVIFYQFGVELIKGTFVQNVFIVLTLITVFMGSMLAYKEKILKKRLAYSTVSQVSYILFGIACLNPVSLLGALLHVIAHSFIKDVLFMSAGAIIYCSGFTKVEQLDGIGKKMPVTMGLFTIASLGLIGIPPLLGFVSKWYLAQGSLANIEGTLGWAGPAVLLVSALLTAGYLFTITINAYFKQSKEELAFSETTAAMLIPMGILVALIVILGMFPNVLMTLFETAMEGLF